MQDTREKWIQQRRRTAFDNQKGLGVDRCFAHHIAQFPGRIRTQPNAALQVPEMMPSQHPPKLLAEIGYRGDCSE